MTGLHSVSPFDFLGACECRRNANDRKVQLLAEYRPKQTRHYVTDGRAHFIASVSEPLGARFRV